MKILFLVESLQNETASNLAAELKQSGFALDIVPYFEGGKDRCFISEQEQQSILLHDNRMYHPKDYTAALLWCWGTADLGRRYLRVFEQQGVMVLNSTDKTIVTDSKLRVQQLLKQANIPTPKTLSFHYPLAPNPFDDIADTLGSRPYVFKTDYGTRGAGVKFVFSRDELLQLSNKLKQDNPRSKGFILQEFVGDHHKPIHHYRVLVIKNEIIPAAIKISARKPLFVSNVASGGNVEFVPVHQDMKSLALRAAAVSGLDVAGIDIMEYAYGDQNQYVVLEVNDSAGTKTFDKAGFQASKKIIHYFIDKMLNNQQGLELSSGL